MVGKEVMCTGSREEERKVMKKEGRKERRNGL
jgi:hypothetical protein